MKIILIQGKENAGKTTLCKKIEKWLIDYFISRGGLKLERQLNYSNKRCDDFLGVYENISDKYCIKKQEKSGSKTKENEGKRENKKIIINSASDNITVIKCFKDFFISNQDNCDVLITAIREQGSLLYKKIEDVYSNEDKDKNGQKIVKVQVKLPAETIDLDFLKSRYSSSTFIEDVFLNEFIPKFFK